MTKTPRVIAVQWNRFGPYHKARLSHLTSFAKSKGISVVAIETAPTGSLYDWKSDTGQSDFDHKVLFPGKDYTQLKPVEIRQAMMNCLDELQVDGVAIQSYSYPDARAALQWCRSNRRTAVLMNVSREEDAERVAWREKFKSILIKQFDAALLSGSQASAYAQRLGMPEKNIFSGCTVIDNDHFANRNPLDFQSREGGFLASSRFMDRKNLHVLIDAYADYRENNTQAWPLTLLGDGKLRDSLEKQIEQLDLNEYVSLPGFCDYNQLPEFYHRAKCFVHPASSDQWALVVNEAMAASLPVLVSTGAGCHVELVEEGKNGFTFDPSDKEKLSRLLTEISSNPKLGSMGDRSAEIISNWSFERFSSELLKAFEKGSATSDRGLSTSAAVAFRTLNLLARDSFSFHTVDS